MALFQAFLQKGADPLAKTEQGMTPFKAAFMESENDSDFTFLFQMALSSPDLQVDGISLIQRVARNITGPFLVELLNQGKNEAVFQFLDLCVKEKCLNFSKLWFVRENDDQSVLLLQYLIEKNAASITPEYAEGILFVSEKILAKNEWSERDIAFVKSLLSIEFMPLLCLKDGYSVLNRLNQHPALPAELKPTFSQLADLESIKAVERSNAIIKNFNTEDQSTFSISKVQLFNELSRVYDILVMKKYPAIHFIKEKMDEYKGQIENQKTKCEWMINKLKKDEMTFYGASSMAFTNGLFDYLIYTNEKDLLAKLINARFAGQLKDIPQFVDRLIFALFLDKVLFPTAGKYEGFSEAITAHALIRAFEQLLQENTLSIEERRILGSFQKNVLSKFPDFMVLYENKEWKDTLFASTIVDKLNKMAPGENLIIPTGHKTHAVSLFITREKNLSYSLTLYNTGQGVLEWHPQWENSNRYQTFWKIENIDQNTITDLEAWQEIHKLWKSDNAMDGVYACLKDRLGKSGVLQKPSIHQEDYEAKQASGSCASQNMMAMMRHQIMLLASDNIGIAEAIYKSIKTKMFRVFQAQYAGKIDKTIQENSSTIFKKFTAEEQLLEIAGNVESYRNAMSEIGSFGNIGIEKLPVLDENSPVFARYANLRAASNLLFAWFLAHPEKAPLGTGTSKALSLVLAKLEHRHVILKNIKSRLDECQANNNLSGLALECYRLIVATAFAEEGIAEVINRMGHELPAEDQEPPAMKEFLTQMNKFHSKYSPTIMALADKMAAKGNTSLAEWIKMYWKKLEAAKQVAKQFD